MKRHLLIQQHIDHEGPGLLYPLLEEYAIDYVIADLTGESPCRPDISTTQAVITLGGPQSANDINRTMRDEIDTLGTLLENEIPYLGICLGMQTLVKAAGGTVIPCPVKETGFHDPQGNRYTIELTHEGITDPLLKGIPRTVPVFQLHGETVELNERIALLGTGAGSQCRNQIVKVGRNAYGLQCHFELTSDMFVSWLERDADLRSMNRDQLKSEFEEIRESYLSTGVTLFRNFLELAGLTQ